MLQIVLHLMVTVRSHVYLIRVVVLVLSERRRLENLSEQKLSGQHGCHLGRATSIMKKGGRSMAGHP